jgi:lipopolysaccharide export system permease protein
MAVIGATFGTYLARPMATMIAVVFLGLQPLVFIIDYVDLLRRSSDLPGRSALAVALLSLERTPAITERTLPFAVLFAAIIAFLQISRRLELLVARATGVSVWQILVPPLLVAALAGLIATALYNPVSAFLADRAAIGEAALLGKPGHAGDGRRYIRQRSVDGQSILRAAAATDRGQILHGVTAFVFTPDGAFTARIDAAQATLRRGYWQLSDARVLHLGSRPQAVPTYLLATNLTPAQVAETLTPAQAVSFWDLPSVIRLWRKAGLPATRFELQYQSLLAAPALLIVMVLIAATVSLRFFRLGGIARVILGGVVAGFVLYLMTKLAEDLGAAGFVPPVAAAWAPAIVGGLISVSVLLHQEDG